MSKALALSIIIPVYNESDHLKNCLDSIQKQTVMPNEVIVVDNNSTDDSVDIASQYSFVKIVTERKQGIANARNTGFNAATSDILGRIDSDSILPENWVAKVLDFFENDDHLKNYAWTSGGYWYNISLPSVYAWFSSQIVFRFNRFILGHYPLWGSSMAITRQSWLRVKRKVCLRNDIHEDLDLSIHLHHLGYQITYASGIRVNVYIRRLYSDFGKMWTYLLLWPRTLRTHKLNRWYLGLIGAIIVYLQAVCLIVITKFLSVFLNSKT
ncbi:MAG TPA: glycosyltransferase family 2 protein [Candidatus Dormibacteraeota bacterium]|nr:glycosyltransferase family 2 protein [Candidatus Dormibacteraeota bacterium]